ncbi:hypothetical protein GCM10023115_38980 [Pontixanthobacter gangjinensis]|uniref:Uncharacterized protein n=1 Tax=Christiangramia aestuarii TaxID=1028746 RepID=A0A7M4C1M6_9FLAO|nr:hypothetical protein [Christiangramia aestuarii]MUP40966.1 hypothetical protein [Christiangramia aestuarii]
MKLKHLFPILCIASVTSLGAQTKSEEKVKPEISITNLNIKTHELSELKDFDWNSFDSIFQNNSPETEINLSFELDRSIKLNSSNIDDFKFVVTGKTSELDSLKIRARRILTKLEESLK